MNHALTLERERAVRDCLAAIGALLDRAQLSASAMAAAQGLLRGLASRTELWSSDVFPIPDGKLWHAYRLNSESEALAAYAVPMLPGHAQPPHDHTTWALIAGVRGRERNSCYERPTATPGPLQVRWETTVDASTSVALGPQDIHAIEVLGPNAAFHLHVYGRSLSDLPDRRTFDLATGTSQPFSFNPPGNHT
ncbi:cysteine dioxygenase family protein [Hydrogenophaga sp. OTU3427]|uniref:cysteine dioxygenase family protein n=1 Tax=Hydrogenophaga sp. OTU3427 TaxID=3043856 RepID=UPI00313E1241